MREIPGGLAFSTFFRMFTLNVSAHDRSGIITTPIKSGVLDHLRMPVYDPNFSMEYAQVVDNRAQQLMQSAKSSNRKLAIMYSGGIDSTVILCSILKNFSDKDIRENVVVLLSDFSIKENENFYYKYVSKRFECVSSFRFPYYVGNDKYITVTGENADQLFGSQANDNFAFMYKYEDLHTSVDDNADKILTMFSSKMDSERVKYVEPIYNLLRKTTKAAPIKIDTIYDFFWWVNFVIKWQSVYVRILPFSNYKDSIKIEDNYTTFFHTEEFQQWSMNNTDKFTSPEIGIGSVKLASKKYIIDVNGDASYMNKPKIGSLARLVKQKEICSTLDTNMKFRYDLPTEDMFNYENDFVEMMK